MERDLFLPYETTLPTALTPSQLRIADQVSIVNLLGVPVTYDPMEKYLLYGQYHQLRRYHDAMFMTASWPPNLISEYDVPTLLEVGLGENLKRYTFLGGNVEFRDREDGVVHGEAAPLIAARIASPNLEVRRILWHGANLELPHVGSCAKCRDIYINTVPIPGKIEVLEGGWVGESQLRLRQLRFGDYLTNPLERAAIGPETDRRGWEEALQSWQIANSTIIFQSDLTYKGATGMSLVTLDGTVISGLQASTAALDYLPVSRDVLMGWAYPKPMEPDEEEMIKLKGIRKIVLAIYDNPSASMDPLINKRIIDVPNYRIRGDIAAMLDLIGRSQANSARDSGFEDIQAEVLFVNQNGIRQLARMNLHRMLPYAFNAQAVGLEGRMREIRGELFGY